MTYEQFHNLLRVLRSIDSHECPNLNAAQWSQFVSRPHDFFISASEALSREIWDVAVKRAPDVMEAEYVLAECADYFHDHMDADCVGDPPEYQPNREMQMYTRVLEVIDHKHTHRKSADRDKCLSCGRDLRDDVHVRAGETP